MRYVVVLASLLAAIGLNPYAIGRLIAWDGVIDSIQTTAMIVAAQILLLVIGVTLIIRWPKNPLKARALAIVGLVLMPAAAIGLYGTALAMFPYRWEEAGVPMAERLTLLNERNKDAFGATSGKLLAQLKRPINIEQGADWLVAGTALRNEGHYQDAAVILEDLLAVCRDAGVSISIQHAVRNRLIGLYLRWGEIENCIANHNPDSCLLPLQGGGIHKITRGSRAALPHIQAVLAENPDAKLARWLLNITHMTLGTYPDEVPQEFRIDPSLMASEAAFPPMRDVAMDAGVSMPGLSGGCVLDDFNNDGLTDIVATSVGLQDQMRLFINRGDGSFEDRTEAAGLLGQTGGLNITHADVNNDGWLDLLVLRGAWMKQRGNFPNSLLRNNGDGTFTDITEQAGLLSFRPTQVGEWSDYDRDGDLDLFIGNESVDDTTFTCELYRNDGEAGFTPIIDQTGIISTGNVKGAAWGDYNNDGWPDLLISRRNASPLLYRNDGPAGRGWAFTDVTEQAGLKARFDGFIAWFWDYDNDGEEDLFIGNYATEFASVNYREIEHGLDAIYESRTQRPLSIDASPRLFRNRGDGTFLDITESAGLARVVLIMGANFGDVDNDGYLDLYLGTGHPSLRALMANRLFMNDRGQRFKDITTAAHVGHLQKGHAIAFNDIDEDGDQDIYAVMGGWFPCDSFPNALYENPGNENHWIKIRLVGQQSNRFGVGAKLKVHLIDPHGSRSTIYRTVNSGGSFGAHSYTAHIGLGQADRIELIEIRWPFKDSASRIVDPPLDSKLVIREGVDGYEKVSTKPYTLGARSDEAMRPSHDAHSH